ncbi:hypothetical protein ACIQGT_14345 [Streptomyces sp. NPDC093108]|uniref:hypothetical protein n=1 Tax=unclassified Streptomyces TaxID=2593676 RepID=UPI00381C2BBE
MNAHSNCQVSACLALAHILIDHPEIQGIAWSVDPLGTLRGERYDLDGDGQVVDLCAKIFGGLAHHSTLSRDGDRTGLSQLTTVWRHVPIEVWVTYPAPAPAVATERG